MEHQLERDVRDEYEARRDKPLEGPDYNPEDVSFHIRVNLKTAERIVKLAKEENLSAEDYIRMVVSCSTAVMVWRPPRADNKQRISL